MSSFPVTKTVDDCMELSAGSNIRIVCDDEIFHTSQFKVGSNKCCPSPSFFGNRWLHVRRLSPYSNPAGIFPHNHNVRLAPAAFGLRSRDIRCTERFGRVANIGGDNGVSNSISH